MISADIYQIAVLLIALAFLILVVFTIPTLVQMRKTVRAVEELSSESKKSIELLNSILKRAGDQADDVEEVLKKVKEVGLKVIGLAELVVDNIKSPLITLLSLFLGFEFGFKRLIKRDKKGGEGDVK
ncbi:MAG TPA: hypothetical protein VJM57_06725 [Thermodesulfobacteriota bacterium]|nr:hypothetical protein [Thermodesulfobacteriota bacterium]